MFNVPCSNLATHIMFTWEWPVPAALLCPHQQLPRSPACQGWGHSSTPHPGLKQTDSDYLAACVGPRRYHV